MNKFTKIFMLLMLIGNNPITCTRFHFVPVRPTLKELSVKLVKDIDSWTNNSGLPKEKEIQSLETRYEGIIVGLKQVLHINELEKNRQTPKQFGDYGKYMDGQLNLDRKIGDLRESIDLLETAAFFLKTQVEQSLIKKITHPKILAEELKSKFIFPTTLQKTCLVKKRPLTPQEERILIEEESFFKRQNLKR
ncbi:hypothetical protein KAW80_03905 [Candidatus Babeliales bacterium]|nr:hypothetical protein [Candidatus Babeliales bacterium]